MSGATLLVVQFTHSPTDDVTVDLIFDHTIDQDGDLGLTRLNWAHQLCKDTERQNLILTKLVMRKKWNSIRQNFLRGKPNGTKKLKNQNKLDSSLPYSFHLISKQKICSEFPGTPEKKISD